MAVKVLDAFCAEPCDRRRVNSVDTIRPQAVNYEDSCQPL
jgi:hypothetical protein